MPRCQSGSRGATRAELFEVSFPTRAPKRTCALDRERLSGEQSKGEIDRLSLRCEVVAAHDRPASVVVDVHIGACHTPIIHLTPGRPPPGRQVGPRRMPRSAGTGGRGLIAEAHDQNSCRFPRSRGRHSLPAACWHPPANDRDDRDMEDASAMAPQLAEEPPVRLELGLEEALELPAALEDARDALIQSDHLAVVAQLEHELQVLNRKLGFGQEGGDER